MSHVQTHIGVHLRIQGADGPSGAGAVVLGDRGARRSGCRQPATGTGVRRPSYTITEGDPYTVCPVRARNVPVDFCMDCPWFEDVDTGHASRSWLLCEPPGYWPLRLEVRVRPVDGDHEAASATARRAQT